MRKPLLLALLPALSACSADGDRYPSLLPRPIESRSDAEPVRPDPVATPDAALDARIAAQLAAAERIATRFRALASEAEAKVAIARGTAPGNDRWIAAQLALADLNAARDESVAIVTHLEATATTRLQAGEAPYPALDAAIARTGTLAQDQADRVAALDAALTP